MNDTKGFSEKQDCIDTKKMGADGCEDNKTTSLLSQGNQQGYIIKYKAGWKRI